MLQAQLLPELVADCEGTAHSAAALVLVVQPTGHFPSLTSRPQRGGLGIGPQENGWGGEVRGTGQAGGMVGT